MNKRVNGRKRQSRTKAVEAKGQWKLYLMMSLCVTILVSGFFFAARQHFSSIDYGIRNSRLRKQLDDLESEKRRLLLAREISVSPAEIKKAAKKFGIGSIPSGEVELASAPKPERSAQAVVPASEKAQSIPSERVLVVKTGMTAEAEKPTKVEKAKKDTAERPRQLMTAALAAP